MAPRTTAFQAKHQDAYGLEIASLNTQGEVSSVRCRFCVCFGREERKGDGGKRKRTSKIKLLKNPFRAEYFRDHVASQHPHRWGAYQKMSATEKAACFSTKKQRMDSMANHVTTAKDMLEITISARIVEGILDAMFVRTPELVDNELSEFGMEEDKVTLVVGGTLDVAVQNSPTSHLFAQQLDGTYKATIKNALRFQLVIDHVAIGMSFR